MFVIILTIIVFFEMSCLSRRSKKIYDEFIICQDKVVDAIVNWLKDALNKGIVNFKQGNSRIYCKYLIIYNKWSCFSYD